MKKLRLFNFTQRLITEPFINLEVAVKFDEYPEMFRVGINREAKDHLLNSWIQTTPFDGVHPMIWDVIRRELRLK